MRKRRSDHSLNVPEKANRILNGILVVLILIVIRIWHLSVIKHDEKIEESVKPQRRVIIEQSERATISDRFGIPLATNKVQYNAAVSYGPIRSLPRWIWKRDEQGKRIKFFYRKEYITSLAKRLSEELRLDPERIEDLIHSKAAILGNVPCLIKENITEKEYFRLKMLEMDWPGIQAEIASKRVYPGGALGGEVVGYIGGVSKEEYDRITHELRELHHCLSLWEEGESCPFPKGLNTVEEVALRLEELEKRAYSINDYVGKVGIEAAFDKELRGLRGKHIYLSDIRGNLLMELEGSEASVAGTHIRLTLSSELQAYAEQLLAEADQAPTSTIPRALKRKTKIPENQPWIKGGAIVAMDPNTGEILALATFPRFDPNDFTRPFEVESQEARALSVSKWLENEYYLSHIWDLKIPITRERFDTHQGMYYLEKKEMDWNSFLHFILPNTSPVKSVIEKMDKLKDSLFVQSEVDSLVSHFQTDEFEITAAKIFDILYPEEDASSKVLISLQERAFLDARAKDAEDQIKAHLVALAPYFQGIHLNYEKLLLIDLYRLVADATLFSPLLMDLLGEMSLSDFRAASGQFASVEEAIRSIMKDIFHENQFKNWREEYFQEYLAEKRKEEKALGKKYARPYIEYLDKAEKELFEDFWENGKWGFLSTILTGVSQEENDPLLLWAKELSEGAHQGLPWSCHYRHLKAITDEFDASLLTPFLKTLRSYEKLNRPLLGRYFGLRGKLEKHLAASFYPQYGYGYARSHAFRQASVIGSIFKLIPAYEALCQIYDKKKEGNLNPLTMIDDKHRTTGKAGGWNVGFTLDGKPIPRYYRGGLLPRSEHPHVGKLDLVHALAASSNPYFAMIAGDILEDPEDICLAASLFGYGEKTGIELPGEYKGIIPSDVAYNRTGLYSMAIGQHSLVGTPLQTTVMLSAIANGGSLLKPTIIKKENSSFVKRQIFLPNEIRDLLIEGMRQVVIGPKGTARFVRREFPPHVINRVIGKTSTAEAVEQFGLDGKTGRLKVKHIWFGSIIYENEDLLKPELVVVVYLRHGEFGKDVAPIAVKVAEKWRKVKKEHGIF